VTAAGERRWFLSYGAASTLYRIAISIGIAFFLINTVPVLGVLMAAWLVTAQLVLPLGRMLRFLLTAPALAGRRPRALVVVGGLLAAVFLLLALVPVPSSTQVDGIVLLPEQAAVRAGVDGFLQEQRVSDGTEVAAGEVLFLLRSRELENELAVLEARVREHQARRDALGFDERVAREIEAERLAEARGELAELREREMQLSVQSPAAGVIRLAVGPDQVGRYLRKGDMLAYLTQPTETVVRVVASQADAGRIRGGSESIEVRLSDRGSTVLGGRLLSEVPLATEVLPSAALGTRAGGAIPVDARDPAGTATLEPVFAFDIAIPTTSAARYVGGRAHVRFDHAAAPLLARAYDAARRELIREIGE
jgi:putative peptide zinc metalloprotease protein